MPKLLNLNRQSNNESQMSNAKGNLSIYLNGSEKKVKQNNVSHDDDDDDDDDLVRCPRMVKRFRKLFI